MAIGRVLSLFTENPKRLILGSTLTSFPNVPVLYAYKGFGSAFRCFLGEVLRLLVDAKINLMVDSVP